LASPDGRSDSAGSLTVDAARAAGMSDPCANYHFSRGWDEPPPLERERPGIAGTMHRANNSGNGNAPEATYSVRLLQVACRIDREADAALALGHTAVAERLSHLAAEMRAVAL